VAVHLHVVRLGECDQSIRLREVEAAALGLDDGKFQRVFRRDEIEFARQQAGVAASVSRRDIHRRADADAGRLSQGPQRIGCCRRQDADKCGSECGHHDERAQGHLSNPGTRLAPPTA
jgi:hypothetical protein